MSEPAKHGTRSKYMGGCRCDECRTAQRNGMRAYNGSPLADLPAITKALNMRAIYKLIEAHLDEYRNLVESEIRRDRADEATT